MIYTNTDVEAITGRWARLRNTTSDGSFSRIALVEKAFLMRSPGSVGCLGMLIQIPHAPPRPWEYTAFALGPEDGYELMDGPPPF